MVQLFQSNFSSHFFKSLTITIIRFKISFSHPIPPSIFLEVSVIIQTLTNQGEARKELSFLSNQDPTLLDLVYQNLVLVIVTKIDQQNLGLTKNLESFVMIQTLTNQGEARKELSFLSNQDPTLLDLVYQISVLVLVTKIYQ